MGNVYVCNHCNKYEITRIRTKLDWRKCNSCKEKICNECRHEDFCVIAEKKRKEKQEMKDLQKEEKRKKEQERQELYLAISK